jgi:hypothetical protein
MKPPRLQIIALVVAAASAQANVGDTIDQLWARWSQCSTVADNTVQCLSASGYTGLRAFFDPRTGRVSSEILERNGAPVLDNDNLQNHCEIVAQRAFEALRNASAWCAIVGLQFTSGDVGHAAVVYKHQIDGPVIYYDDRGSLELPTTSTNIWDIMGAMNRIPKHFNGGIKELRFLTD